MPEPTGGDFMFRAEMEPEERSLHRPKANRETTTLSMNRTAKLLTRSIHTFLALFIAIMISVSCAPEREPVDADALPEDQATLWQDQRDEFIDLSENQLSEFESQIQQYRNETGVPDNTETQDELSDIENRIVWTREQLVELEDAQVFDWEEMRNEIADSINQIQNDIEAQSDSLEH